MNAIARSVPPLILILACLTSAVTSILAQEVSIPDPGLNAAIREALQVPTGPLTGQTLLGLTNLNAGHRDVRSAEGLEAARNLVSLDLQRNHLASFLLPDGLTNLTSLDLSFNSITNCVIPEGITRLTTLVLADNQLTTLSLPTSLSGLTSLNLEDNGLISFNLPASLTNLVLLDLGFNSLTDLFLPNGLISLTTLIAAGNQFTNFTLPTGLSGLTELDLHINKLTSFTLPPGVAALTNLDLSENQLDSFTLPAGLTNLSVLDCAFNTLTNLSLPDDQESLTELDLDFNRFTGLNLPTGLTRLSRLHLRANQFADFSLRADLAALTYLDVSENPLVNLTLPGNLGQLATLRLSKDKLADLILPAGLTNLTGLIVSENQLTNLVLPSDLGRLDSLNLNANQLTDLSLPAGLTNLTGLFVTSNQLTQLVLPPDMTKLTALGFLANPLGTFVLSEPLATSTNLTEILDSLQSQGASVLTYPLAVQLVRLQQSPGAFRFGVTGPPGTYTISTSPDLEVWSVLGSVSNPLGSIFFTDVAAHLSPQKFYRALPQSPPANMVFVPPNTFTLGSSEDEAGHSADEGPQTIVTLSHGFWMSKYLVTQEDYLAVMGVNPSGFPGDLNRPAESVTWPDATNYCAALTQLNLAAARIPPGSHYRLPTEAEWECAARAGTSTRFYYGADADLTGLADHAWYGANSGLTTHPVGQKEPNAWGLYDMAGNVWEWCQDWYGSYPGGSVRDPQGPASNSIGFKVIRGGAWEASEFDCRSASRWFEPASPFISDFIIGFRVVLAVEP